jgi:hypothetical protein
VDGNRQDSKQVKQEKATDQSKPKCNPADAPSKREKQEKDTPSCTQLLANRKHNPRIHYQTRKGESSLYAWKNEPHPVKKRTQTGARPSMEVFTP